MTDLDDRLRKLDPAKEWAAWQPSPRDPWRAKWAGHLYRRAAFGGSWPQIQAAVKAGPEAAVEKLLAGGPGLAEFDQIMDAVAPAQPPNALRAATTASRASLRDERGAFASQLPFESVTSYTRPLSERGNFPPTYSL